MRCPFEEFIRKITFLCMHPWRPMQPGIKCLRFLILLDKHDHHWDKCVTICSVAEQI